jgi:orotate phosphoribosyltransferase
MNAPLLVNLPVRLYDDGVVKIDTEVGFRLKHHDTHPDDPLSPIYLNLRTPDNPKPGPMTPDLVSEIGLTLWLHAKAQGLEFDAVCGLPNAGIPLADAFVKALYAYGQLVPNVVLGKTETAGNRKIEGVLDSSGAITGDTVLVIDDLITHGDSKFEGIEELRKAGFKVTDVLVLVDREQGGRDDLLKHGIRLWSLTTLRKIVNGLFTAGKISARERDTVLGYLDAR